MKEISQFSLGVKSISIKSSKIRKKLFNTEIKEETTTYKDSVILSYTETVKETAAPKSKGGEESESPKREVIKKKLELKGGVTITDFNNDQVKIVKKDNNGQPKVINLYQSYLYSRGSITQSGSKDGFGIQQKPDWDTGAVEQEEIYHDGKLFVSTENGYYPVMNNIHGGEFNITPNGGVSFYDSPRMKDIDTLTGDKPKELDDGSLVYKDKYKDVSVTPWITRKDIMK